MLRGWYARFRAEVLTKLPCFGPYWSKYVYADVSEHVAGGKASLHDFTMVGNGCFDWLRTMGLRLPAGALREQRRCLEALRELRDVTNSAIESGQHRGLAAACADGRLAPLTAYDVQVQCCECKRGFQLVARIAAQRKPLVF